MSEQLPTYAFLPWLRVGVANSITQPDSPGANISVRATIVVNLNVTGNNVNGGTSPASFPKPVSLYGPGDVVGVHQDAIIKVEPRNWITNFEPNFLPYIEFYDEDFPWRYTPAAADKNKHRLRPWIALVVLTTDEFESGNGKPLPFLDVSPNAASAFPASDQLWAWAHVHVNSELPTDGANPSMPNVPALEAALRENPDRAYSRILCPRRLEPDTLYHAFLIPTFETGRLAGLGLDVPEAMSGLDAAWGENKPPTKFPYYYRWRFKTGVMGDFEYLVKILKPQPADKRVGFRDMDVLHPGVGLPPIALPAELGGVLKLGGALRVPLDSLRPEDQQEVQKFENWDDSPQGSYPHEFQEAMAARVNLADDYTHNQPAALHPDDPDPVVTSPLYGRWHALKSRLLENSQGGATHWVDELNLDPRFRAAAGLGTGVVQKNQEEFMNAAWEQVGDIIAANNRLRLAQFAMGASRSLFFKHFTTQPAAFVMTAPVHKRVLVDGVTVHSKVASSIVPQAVLSAAFRKLTRARGPIMKRLGVVAGSAIVEGINDGTFVPAPPKTAPEGAVKVDDAIGELGKAGADKAVLDGMADQQEPSVVDGFPKIGDFTIQDPHDPPRDKEWPQSDLDSDEAKAFKQALRDVYTFTGVAFPEPSKLPLDLEGLTEAVLHTLDPAISIPKRIMSTVVIPEHIKADMLETFAPVMVYPVIDLPMYKALAEISSELFLPHIDLIPPNSLTLLEVNQKFIESYMMGLNHEMARELLWREYPTDQRGSYFRQFWDVSNMFTSDNPTEEQREPLRDIPKIHMWPSGSTLGSHNHRDMGTNAGQLVLVIRGELLKRYPTAVIYAQKAAWPTDGSAERKLEELTDQDYDGLAEGELPEGKIRLPLFEAKVEPDIYLIGFNLSTDDVKGGGEPPNGDPGWFFVIKERPGEARFGLDETTDDATLPPLINWNDLTWGRVGTQAGNTIQVGQEIALLQPNPNPDDDQASWSLDTTNAADLAYILYQVPVLVAVHASRMLPDLTPGTP